jgi:cis-2,3-dihydrobiphenyl-2,3-diol dehydrogenase
MADNQRAVDACVARFGRLDCAIGNAGIWDYSVSLDALPAEKIGAAFDELFHVNVKGYLNLAKAALPALVRSSGALIFTVSNAGFDPAGGGPLYTASKHAVVGLIRQLAYELAPAVRVNGVAPGPIETDLRGPGALGLADRSIGGLNLSAVAGPNVPLGRVPATSDYAGGYVFLASRRDSRPATGGVLSLDTGIAVRGIGRASAGAGLAAKYGAGSDSAKA